MESHTNEFVTKLFKWLQPINKLSPNANSGIIEQEFEQASKRIKPEVLPSPASEKLKDPKPIIQTFPIESINTRTASPR